MENFTFKKNEDEIVIMDYENRSSAFSNELDNKANLLADVNVYKNSSLDSEEIIRIEKKGALISFHREVVRKGKNMLIVKEPDGETAYIKYDPNHIEICQQCQVKEDSLLDFILISHNDFDQVYVEKKVDIRKIDNDQEFESIITKHLTKTNITIKDYYKDDKGYFVSALNSITLNSIEDNFKIGRLDDFSKFYITKSLGNNQPKKIKTAEGIEGIVISNENLYKEINNSLIKITSIFTTIITFILLLGTIFTILAMTGWFILVGIIMIPIAALIANLITMPMYLILKFIIKFF